MKETNKAIAVDVLPDTTEAPGITQNPSEEELKHILDLKMERRLVRLGRTEDGIIVYCDKLIPGNHI